METVLHCKKENQRCCLSYTTGRPMDIQGHQPRSKYYCRRSVTSGQTGLRSGLCYADELNISTLQITYMILSTRLFQLFGDYSVQQSCVMFWFVVDVLPLPAVTWLPCRHHGSLYDHNARQRRDLVIFKWGVLVIVAVAVLCEVIFMLISAKLIKWHLL